MWSLRSFASFFEYVECYSKFFMKWPWPLLLHTPGPLWKPPTWCGRHRTHWKLTATSTVAPTPPSTSPQDWFGLNLTSLWMGNRSGEASASGRFWCSMAAQFHQFWLQILCCTETEPIEQSSCGVRYCLNCSLSTDDDGVITTKWKTKSVMLTNSLI